jgi:hypothetical protein
MLRPRTFPLLCLLVLVAAACTTTSTTTAVDPTTTRPTPAPTGVDPLVPYSPPTPDSAATTGFIPDTLTAPTTVGGALRLTPVTTTMTTVYIDETRALTVYLTATNPGDGRWHGTIGADAEVTDLSGGVFPAARPADGDLHPDPSRYGGSNRSFLRPVSLAPGASARGALVFHVTGGNRPITLRISLDDGTTWVEWATNLGVF